MTSSLNKNRIIFIDLLRAFAVLQMVQGHTVDVLLSDDYRNMDSIIFSIWFFMRGMTAPIFLFTAGTVFTYLLRLSKENFFNNPRVKKGFIRFITLVVLGYLLRYPTYKIIDFSDVSQEQLLIFFAVDVLQLIGFGLLFILILAFISEKVGKKDTLIFTIGALFFFLFWPIAEKINWSDYFAVPISNYFYQKNGSLFPLFPWAGYLMCGAILGSYLAKNPRVFRAREFSLNLAVSGGLLLFIYFVINSIKSNISNQEILYWLGSISLISLRVGFVLVLNSLVSFISLKISNIPKLLILIGRNTLLIYIVHLIILYGSAWSPGLIILFSRTMNAWETLAFVILMIITMTLMVIALNKLKIKNKQLVA